MSEVTFGTPILQHYQAALLNLAIYTDENGLCYTKKNGTDIQIPTVIENRRLTLPTEKFLSNPDLDKNIAFHPFCESVVRGESEMISWMKERMSMRITTILVIMIMDLIELAADGELQKKLTTDQLSAIQLLGDADEKTSDNIGALLEAVSRGNGQLIHMYLRHSGKNGDKQCKRFCKVTFPLYQHLVDEENKIFGVTLRVKDRKFLKATLEYIFEKIGTEDAYSYGSNSDVAPYYHALIHAYAKVGVPMSSRIYLFRKHMPKIANSRIHVDGWLDTFEEAAQGARFMTSLPFNVGTGGQGSGNENAQAQQSLATAQNLRAGAAVVPEVDEVTKTNQQLSQIPNSGSGLQQIINGGPTNGNQNGSLSGMIFGGTTTSLFSTGQNQPQSVLSGLPRSGNTSGNAQLNFGQQQTQPATDVFGRPIQQQQSTGLFGNSSSLFGGQSNQNQFGNGGVLGGLPRR